MATAREAAPLIRDARATERDGENMPDQRAIPTPLVLRPVSYLVLASGIVYIAVASHE